MFGHHPAVEAQCCRSPFERLLFDVMKVNSLQPLTQMGFDKRDFLTQMQFKHTIRSMSH